MATIGRPALFFPALFLMLNDIICLGNLCFLLFCVGRFGLAGYGPAGLPMGRPACRQGRARPAGHLAGFWEFFRRAGRPRPTNIIDITMSITIIRQYRGLIEIRHLGKLFQLNRKMLIVYQVKNINILRSGNNIRAKQLVRIFKYFALLLFK